MYFDWFLYQNVVSTSMAHSTAPHAPLFCSLHILMSTMIYYWTVTWQHKIYLLRQLFIKFILIYFWILMFKQGTFLQHGDSQRDLFTKVKSKYTYFKNVYKDKISQTKSQRKTCINIAHRSKVQNCNLSWLSMLLKIDCLQLKC